MIYNCTLALTLSERFYNLAYNFVLHIFNLHLFYFFISGLIFKKAMLHFLTLSIFIHQGLSILLFGPLKFHNGIPHFGKNTKWNFVYNCQFTIFCSVNIGWALCPLSLLMLTTWFLSFVYKYTNMSLFSIRY